MSLARWQPTDDGVQAFANEYGALGIGGEIMLLDGTRTRGERLQEWKAEIDLDTACASRLGGTEEGYGAGATGDGFALICMGIRQTQSICRTNLGLQTCRWMSQTYSPEYCPATQHSSCLSASPWPCSDPPGTGTPATPAGLALAFIRTLMSTRLPLQYGGMPGLPPGHAVGLCLSA